MENKTLEELVKEHGFGVCFSSLNHSRLTVIGESTLKFDSYIVEDVSGYVYFRKKSSTSYYYEKPKVKRAQYLLLHCTGRPVKTAEFYIDEQDLWSFYPKGFYRKVIRLTETEREFDW